MKKKTEESKDKKEIDLGKMGMGVVSLIAMSPFLFPNLNIPSLDQIASITSGIGYALATGGGVYLTLDVTKQFIDKRKGK